MPRSNTQGRPLGPARFAVLALDHAQDRLHGRNVGAVAIECLIAERKAFAVDDERNYHLLAVGTMVARVAAAYHRVLFRGPLHVRAGQIIKQYIELSPEQFAVALLQMPFELRLMRQDTVQTAI